MNVIIGNAWPYANGPLHLGRIAVLMPGDVLARYHRLMGDDVVFISGSDSHGTPVDMKAKEEGISPLEVAEKYHEEFCRCFNKLGFSFDLFTKTHTEYHSRKVQEFILDLYEKGYIYEKEVEQTFCEKCNEYLLDKYIEGKCPHCGEIASGDQCTECSEIFETEDLKDKRCKICGSEPVVKKTKHLFFALSKFENDVRRIYIKQKGWRENAEVITKRYLDEGLRDRAVTRDFNWGIDVPLVGYEDKKIYVWIEAVMGYLTASMMCIEKRNENYMDYWNGEDSRIYFVHGKDNIPFHTIIFPSLLAGLGIKNPCIREISSEYLKLEGKKFSTTKNWAIWIDYLTDNYNTDLIRYYLILNGPEKRDSDFVWKDFISTNNNDLVGLYGNFVNRTLTFLQNNFNGKVPEGKMPQKLKDELFNVYFDVGDRIEEGRFKDGLQQIINVVKKANKFFDEEKPWERLADDKKKCAETIYICIQIIANLSNLFEPFMPYSSKKIREYLNIDEAAWSYVEKKTGNINKVDVLFEKIDKKNITKEVLRLKNKVI
ncbi:MULTISPECIES: methionine--tRNA ligase [Clostridium]|uniref:Methionine--tRNA ligase n=1 Tax=Clostridium cibarium TaxID=2762247 RepID=A0ABR8PRX2_9CLOT|nr:MULTISPECIES: methionine--tRNA ligase [Clostridium]MBD7910923.1 methionine--tRNA ligase [Clostridium cibarium]